MDKTNVISPAPHLVTSERLKSVAVDELIALLPAALLGVVQYGLRALLIFVISAAFALLLTIVLHVAFHKRLMSVDFMYAIGAGILSSFCLGSGCELWLPAVSGAASALALYFLPRRTGTVFHPALVSVAFVMLIFPVQALRVCEPIEGLRGFFTLSIEDLVFSSAPAAHLIQGYSVNLSDLLIGGIAGTVGLTGSMPLIVGGCYLMLRRISFPDAPLIACVVVFILALLFPVGDNAVRYALGMILSGSFMFGTMFFLYPAAGAPVSCSGRALYAICYGLLNFLMRRFFTVDGTVTALLLLQAFSWDFDIHLRIFAERIGSFFSDGFDLVIDKVRALITKDRHSNSSRKAVRPNSAPAISVLETDAVAEENDISYELLTETETEEISEETASFDESEPSQEEVKDGNE